MQSKTYPIDIDLDFCVEHKISVEAFCYAYLLYLDKRRMEGLPLIQHRPSVIGEKGSPMAQIYRYAELVQPWSTGALKQLIDRGFAKEMPPERELENRRMGGQPRYFPDYMEITPKFADAYMATYTRFQQFWDAYPASISGFNDPRDRIMLRAVDKEEVEKLYYTRVRTLVEHDRLMDAVNWGKKHGKITMNIKNYLAGENWKVHLEEMTEGVNTGGTLLT